MILTRPQAVSELFWAGLTPLLQTRCRPVICPLLEIRTLDVETPDSDDLSAIFSSSNGVRAALEGRGRRAFCVGAATTELARSRNWRAEMAGQNADELIAHVRRAAPSGPLVHFSGRHTRGDICGALSASGLNASNVALYDQVPLAPDATCRTEIRADGPKLVPLFSPRTAGIFASHGLGARGLHVVAFSPAVADALGDLQVVDLVIARQPDAQSMRDALEIALNRLG